MVKQVKHVLIAAGGTGGHVYPGLAVACFLREHDIKVTWIGTRRGLESRVIPENDIPLEIVKINGLRGKGLTGWLVAPYKVLAAIFQSLAIIRRIRPDAVLGMGGFVSGPAGMAAFLSRKPLYIHEQNAIPGLTNRVLSLFARKVMQAFPGSFNRKDIMVTGNPVRNNILNVSQPAERIAKHDGKLRVLIVGGSLGAQALNESIPYIMSSLPQELQPEVWHQTGRHNLTQAETHYQKAGYQAKLAEFIEDMSEAYEWADLVICRAGALTVSELANAGVASILVPFPYAVDDHQTANASFLVQHDAAVLIQQDNLKDELKAVLVNLFEKGRETILSMANAAKALSMPDATRIVASVCVTQEFQQLEAGQ